MSLQYCNSVPLSLSSLYLYVCFHVCHCGLPISLNSKLSRYAPFSIIAQPLRVLASVEFWVLNPCNRNILRVTKFPTLYFYLNVLERRCCLSVSIILALSGYPFLSLSSSFFYKFARVRPFNSPLRVSLHFVSMRLVSAIFHFHVCVPVPVCGLLIYSSVALCIFILPCLFGISHNYLYYGWYTKRKMGLIKSKHLIE